MQVMATILDPEPPKHTKKRSALDEVECLSHTKWECKCHVVFIPKCRRKTLHRELRRHLGIVFRRSAEQKESQVEEGHLRRVRQQFRERRTLEPQTHFCGRKTLLTDKSCAVTLPARTNDYSRPPRSPFSPFPLRLQGLIFLAPNTLCTKWKYSMRCAVAPRKLPPREHISVFLWRWQNESPQFSPVHAACLPEGSAWPPMSESGPIPPQIPQRPAAWRGLRTPRRSSDAASPVGKWRRGNQNDRL